MTFRTPWFARQTPAHADRVQSKPPRKLRRAGALTALLAGIVLTGTCLRAIALTDEAVYIYDSNGKPVLCTTDSYSEGHVYQNSPYVEIGTVDSNGYIDSDSTGQVIGFIDPSVAATEAFGG